MAFLRGRPSPARSWRCYQGFRRDVPFTVQLPGHPHCESAFPGQNVGRALARSEQSAEIGLGVTARLHAIADRIDRVRRLDRPSLTLVVLDNQREEIEAVGFRRARFGLTFEISFDLVERRIVVGLGANRRISFFAMIRSPDRCGRILNECR
jgi:hypothetical protein